MADKLPMVALSPTMTAGRIARWKVAEGSAFKAGATLLEVETDKASMDYEAPRDGVLLKILVPEGGDAAVGDPIAIVGKEGEDISALLKAGSPEPARPAAAPAAAANAAPAAAAPSAPPAAAPPAAAPPAAAAQPRDRAAAAEQGGPALPAGVQRSSPLARTLARELGVDLRAVRGSGPGGRVVRRDVEGAAQAPAAAPREAAPPRASSSVPVSPMRSAIARRLSESYREAPHFYLKRRVPARALLDLRSASGEGRERPVSLNALLVKLAAAALARHPEINVAWRGSEIEARSAVDIGLAVALPGGLVTPVVRDCPAKGLLEIDGELAALVAKAKEGRLAPPEYEGAGFTITNLGSFGVEEFTAIINPPASAILAVGAIADEPFVEPGGAIAVRKAFTVVLGCDHRSIDGAAGAAFLADLAALLENPARALL